eukprot:1077130-Rhodomonas_salina.1
MVACAWTSPWEILRTSWRCRVASRERPRSFPPGSWPMSPRMACAHASRPIVGCYVTGTAATLTGGLVVGGGAGR